VDVLLTTQASYITRDLVNHGGEPAKIALGLLKLTVPTRGRHHTPPRRRVAGHGLGTSPGRARPARRLSRSTSRGVPGRGGRRVEPDAYRWWVRFGFVPFDPDDEHNLDLYLLTADIECTIEELER
jgi:hypothetical protein